MSWPPARLYFLAFSGHAGPKLQRGDGQVPEGLYRLADLNPNSRFHLSIRVDYSNEEDIARATLPRNALGDDIFVHGSNRSAGCLAMSDAAIEDRFSLAAVPPLGDALLGPDDPGRARRLDWAKLLRRSFAVDVLTCSRCGGPMRLVALIENEATAHKILAHLGLPVRAPPRGHPRRSDPDFLTMSL